MRVKKIKLVPTPHQKGVLTKMLAEHRFLYNHCLALKIDAYNTEKKILSCFDLIKSEIKKLKTEGKFETSNYSSLQQTVRRLDKAYQSFFRRIKTGGSPGFPRFKNADRFRTIEYGKRGDGNQIKKESLYLQNVGLMKCLWFGDFPDYKTMSLSKIGDSFYANFIVETQPEKPFVTNKAIGLDFGLKTFLTTSDGLKIESPKFHKQSLKELAKIHRRIHRADKEKRKRYKKALAKLQQKVANRRQDFNHKLSRKLVQGYDFIFLEDIILHDLQSDFRNINRTYADVAFGQLRQFLTYKAENAGKILKTVNPAYTTQECWKCGARNKLELKDRLYVCPCGHSEDRDINAAKNILRRGLASLETA